MPVELALAFAPSPLWRVERTDPALRFSLLNPVDVMNDRAGNRFDIPGAGVLYGTTTVEGGFAETLAGFRPRPSMVKAFSKLTPEPGRVLPGFRGLAQHTKAANLPRDEIATVLRSRISGYLRLPHQAGSILAPTNMYTRSTPESATFPGLVTLSAGRSLMAHSLSFVPQSRWIRQIRRSGM